MQRKLHNLKLEDYKIIFGHSSHLLLTNFMKTHELLSHNKNRSSEYLVASYCRGPWYFNSNLLLLLIDVQPKKSTQKQHTTQRSPTKEAIKRPSTTGHKNSNMLITCKTTNQHKNINLFLPLPITINCWNFVVFCFRQLMWLYHLARLSSLNFHPNTNFHRNDAKTLKIPGFGVAKKKQLF